MALLHMDSFDHYLTAHLPALYSVIPIGGVGSGAPATIGAVGRRSTSGVWMRGNPNSGNSGYLLKAFTPIGNTYIIGAAVRWVGAGTSQYYFESPSIFQARKAGTQQCAMRLNPNSGLLELIRGTTIVATSTTGLALSTYTFLEMKVEVAPGTAGSVEFRVNGATVLGPLPGQNTANQGTAGWDQILFGHIASGPGSGGNTLSLEYDDMYVLDGSGDAPWNNFIGDCRVEPKYVIADGTVKQWMPTTGTNNAAMIDEVTPDDDTTTVSSVTPGDTDTYVVQDATPGAGPTAIQLTTYLKKAAEGLAPTFGVIRTGSPPENYLYPMTNLGTTYAMRTLPLMANPATGLPWTEADFNAAEFGFSRG